MSYHSGSESDIGVGVTCVGGGDGSIDVNTRQSQIWTIVRVTIHCHSRGFSQVIDNPTYIYILWNMKTNLSIR